MDEIKINNSDVLVLEGTIRNAKVRIILVYFDSTKLKSGKDFNRNRKLQKELEKLMVVDPDLNLICLGDFNGRLTKIETNIVTDANGKMIEDWTTSLDLHHLNVSEQCTGNIHFIAKMVGVLSTMYW